MASPSLSYPSMAHTAQAPSLSCAWVAFAVFPFSDAFPFELLDDDFPPLVLDFSEPSWGGLGHWSCLWPFPPQFQQTPQGFCCDFCCFPFPPKDFPAANRAMLFSLGSDFVVIVNLSCS